MFASYQCLRFLVSGEWAETRLIASDFIATFDQKASQALEYFIVQVNNIHLKQLQQTSETQSQKTEFTSS
ncbi:hypothetical protein [Nostoc sp. LPT]|uniref:hypothetical protein n=1 Tax=Nostoc sp. LPT TaxID=2815387 RepID=UPI0034568A5B